ncbi:saccharopine dehydrogenase NADP-binding domain-containing protein [Aliamphritea spongicola]|nr:saccharopine dehydrogenase NADP-binding domain-containing protein [Aliamphritea spongicola]
MSKVMIIGAGGVGGVVAQKCAQVAEIFDDIILASRTESKCVTIAEQVKEKPARPSALHRLMRTTYRNWQPC